MKKISSLKTYLTKPYKCFIPKCSSKCCVNAPLPEGFLPQHKDKIQRPVYEAFNIGLNDLRDTHNSIVYSTRPITLVGRGPNGEALYGISKQMMEAMQIKSMEDVKKILDEYEAKRIYNYCPFITEYGKCSVYEQRPKICREFGTLTDKPNICPEKASRLDIIKIYIQDFSSAVADIFKLIKGKR